MDEREVETIKLMSGLIEPQTRSEAFSVALAHNLGLFAEVYRQQLTELAVVGYREALKDLTIEKLNRGCALALRSCKFMPTPAEILTLSDGQRGDPCNAEKQEPTVCEKCAPDGYKLVSRTVGSTEKCLARCDHK